MSDQDEAIETTLSEARAARENAYVPYSKFRMGAAVLTDTGKVLRGTLVENVSLGLAMCAERVALFSSVAQAAGKPTVLSLVAPRTDGRLTFPCGACLQVALELAGPDLTVAVSDTKGETETFRLSELAPHFPHKD